MRLCSTRCMLPLLSALMIGTIAWGAPTINVWYGTNQNFGKVGTPQRWVNILGNVSGGATSLEYQLNGGPAIPLSQGPDTRRLSLTGDFNIDLRYDELAPGSNTLVITADGSTSKTVTIQRTSGLVWPKNYTVAWSLPSSLQDSAQVVDGKWTLSSGGIRPIELGYDRLVAIGDTTWDDYEVTAQITVNNIDSSATSFGPVSGGPAIGFIMRWKGHTDNPTFDPAITQPKSGYLPYGAIGWYHFREGFGSGQLNRWELMGNNLDLLASNSSQELIYGVKYNFKMRVKNNSGGGLYSFKVWEDGQSEPSSWLMSGQENLSDPQKGCLLLVAHHVSATIKTVSVTPIGNVTTPVLVSPLNNSTNQPTTLMLTWEKDLAAATYRVQVSTDPNFVTGMVVDDPAVTDNFRQVSGSSSGTKYYWRVSASNTDETSAFSAAWNFTSNLATPALVSPLNNVTNQPTSLTLVWTTVPTATSYRVQVATDAGFSSGVVVDDPTVTDTLRLVSGLANNTKYYWRVRAENSGGPGTYSSVRNFTTTLAVPTLASPADNAKSQPISLTVSWNPVAGATSYRLQVSTDPGLAGGFVVNDSTISGTSRAVGVLAYDTKYYWRVNAKNVGGTSAFSAVRNFTTTLSTPNLAFPANNSSGQPTDLAVKWNIVVGATSYHLQLSTDQAFAGALIVNDSTLTDTARAVNGLVAATTYYWRVKAKNANGSSAFSVEWSFSTSLPSPALKSPDNNVTGQPISITLVWFKVAAASAYQLQLGTDPTFTTGLVKNDSTIVDTFRVVNGLLNGTKYYWRVSARNGGGAGVFSSAWNFTTAAQLPAQVVLVAPLSPTTITADSALFVWRKSQPGVNRYWFEISLDSVFTLHSVDSTWTDTARIARQLMDQQTYWWRVRAGNTGGWGPFSEIRKFNRIKTDVENERGVPQEFALSQNYPNPFNPSTTINFALPLESQVRLEVYNTLGERVAILLDEIRYAGRYSVRFDASGLASGVYFYRLSTNTGSLVRRMLLIR